MVLQSSGPISIGDIAAEFGGTAPHSLSEYYGVAPGIPPSGTISISDFYGASAGINVILTIGDTLGTEVGYMTSPRSPSIGSLSIDPLYLNGKKVISITHYTFKTTQLLYVVIPGNVAKDHFTSITTETDGEFLTSASDHSYNSTDNWTLWGWGLPDPPPWFAMVGQTIDISFVE